jgi:hypothetical protein
MALTDEEKIKLKKHFDKEKSEHPEFSDDDVWKIVEDHYKLGEYGKEYMEEEPPYKVVPEDTETKYPYSKKDTTRSLNGDLFKRSESFDEGVEDVEITKLPFKIGDRVRNVDRTGNVIGVKPLAGKHYYVVRWDDGETSEEEEHDLVKEGVKKELDYHKVYPRGTTTREPKRDRDVMGKDNVADSHEYDALAPTGEQRSKTYREEVRYGKIILTVPHATGENDKEHTYDKIAKDVAVELDKKLKEKGIEVETIIGNIERTDIDLNRPESRDTEFRNKISNAITEDAFLIDVHSFPPDDPSNAPFDVVVYDIPVDRDDIYVADILFILNKVGLVAGYHKAYTRDDIVMQMLSEGANAVLLEFNENIEGKIEMIVELVAEGIERWLKGEGHSEAETEAFMRHAHHLERIKFPIKEDVTTGNAGGLMTTVLPKKIRRAKEPASVEQTEEDEKELKDIKKSLKKVQKKIAVQTEQTSPADITVRHGTPTTKEGSIEVTEIDKENWVELEQLTGKKWQVRDVRRNVTFESWLFDTEEDAREWANELLKARKSPTAKGPYETVEITEGYAGSENKSVFLREVTHSDIGAHAQPDTPMNPAKRATPPGDMHVTKGPETRDMTKDKRSCPICGRDNNEDVSRCGFCSYQFRDELKCPQCGSDDILE